MKTMSAALYSPIRNPARARRTTPMFDRPDEEKLHLADLLLVTAEVGSAVAACFLLNWLAT